MRTQIEIDNGLLQEAMMVTRLPTAEVTVEEALKRLVLDERRRLAIDDMAGLGWTGDLDAMREGRAAK